MIIKHLWIKSLLIVMILSLSACGGSGLTDAGNDVSGSNWEVADFTYTNQNGERFGLSDLEGEVWLANFIFTNCETVCSPMSAHMAKLQQQLQEEGLTTPIVSFSVDPERDTPDVLRTFADQFGADFSTWHFLTGYSFAEIKALSETSFKSALAEPAEGTDQFTHGTLFYLIDSNHVIKTYDGVSDVPYDSIVEDVKILSQES